MCENWKSCILTAKGLNTLENQQKKDNKTYIDIANESEISRDTVSDIFKQYVCNRGSISKLFEKYLNRDLKNDDYQCFPQGKIPENHKKPKKPRPPSKPEISITLSPQETIKQAVKELNYQNQIRKFTDFLDLENYNKVGAFLIYGKRQYGQRWLINRLCFEVPYFINTKCETLPLKRYRYDISPLWQDLARRFGSKSNSPQDIVEAIYQHWQSQTIIICFSHFNYPEICGQYLNYLISNFWQPLVNKTGESKSKYSLLLFFLDESECNKDTLGMPIIQDFDKNTSWNICELNELSCFTNEHLKRWLGKHEKVFETVKNKELATIFDEVMGYNQKTPEDVLDQVCSYFNLTWYDIETTLPIQIKER
jgi:hypothetical protein